MPDFQATATHQGLNIVSLDFTLSRGVRPSACYVMAIPLQTYTGNPGTLTLTYGQQSLTFSECAVDHTDLRIERGRLISLRILDRRWKWQAPIVTYRANLQLDNGAVRSDTLRNPQQIATALFFALGETNYNVSDMPTNIYPFVEWDATPAVDALEELCDLCGCIVVLGIDDVVYIRRLGQGASLPFNPLSMSELYPTASAIRPARIAVRTGEVVVQSKLSLDAVTREADGRIVTIGTASYKPSLGWGYEPYYTFGNVTGTYTDRDNQTQFYAHLALENVWRLYRVASQAQGGYAAPGLPHPIASMEQYTLLQHLNDFALDHNSVRQPLPAYVEGSYWPESDSYANTPSGTRYPGKFTIHQNGLVHFDRPVVKLASDYTFTAPDLYLTTTYLVRPNVTTTNDRYAYGRDVDGNGRGIFGINRHDLIPRIVQRYGSVTSPSTMQTNGSVIDAVCDAHINSVYQSVAQQPAQDAWYAGWIGIQLDGAISQIYWTMGRKGTYTRVLRTFQYAPPLQSLN